MSVLMDLMVSPQAIEAVYPKAEIQQCIIHQILNSTKYVSYKDIKKLMADLKLVYAAPTEEASHMPFNSFYPFGRGGQPHRIGYPPVLWKIYTPSTKS